MIDIPFIGSCIATANATARIDFEDEAGEPVVPDSVSYAVIDLLSGTTLVSSTSVTATNTYVNISLPITATTMHDATRLTEIHEIKVTFTFHGTKTNYYIGQFEVVNK